MGRISFYGEVDAGSRKASPSFRNYDITPLLEWYERDGSQDMPYPPDYPKMPGEPKRVQPSKDRDLKG